MQARLSTRFFMNRCFRLLQVYGAQCALVPGYREEQRIELRKRGVDGGMGGVAAIAVCRRGYHLAGLPAIIETKEGPFSGKARLVLYMHFNPHHTGLEVARLVD